jgi:O-antigen/teichoic acid export membrane protein
VLKRLTSSSLFKDTSHLATGQGLRLITQAAYFVLIARSLGPANYGAFATAVALAAALSPFSGLGTNTLFIKNVRSEKRVSSVCWGNGLAVTIVSGTLLSFLVLLISHLLHLRLARGVLISVCISDLILMRITELAANGFLAIGRMKDNAIQNVAASALRLTAIAALALLDRPVQLERWASAYLAASVLATLYTVRRAHQLWGAPTFNWSYLREDTSEGIYFSIGTAAATIYNDVDKIMLGKVSYVAVGIYAAAYRIIDVSMTPIRSLASAAYPRFFQKGMGGMKPAYDFAATQIGRSSVYSVVLFAMLWLTAPLLPKVLGADYANATLALRWLAVLPVLRGVHVFLADSLSGAGFQALRSAIQVLIALVNVGLNLAILPTYGWRGAAWTSIASDGLLVVALWIAVRYKLRTSKQASVYAVEA